MITSSYFGKKVVSYLDLFIGPDVFWVFCSDILFLLHPQSSCIPFSYWKETVSVLLGPDRTSLCAIASYIDEPFMDLDRDLLED